MGRYPKGGRKNNDSSASGSNKSAVFDKTKYRDLKYGNQHKIDKWALKRKKELLRELKNETHVSKKFIKSIARDTRGQNLSKDKLQEKQQRLLKGTAAQKEESKRRAQEKMEAIKKSKERRFETFKKLSKKTKKGQPVMKDRIEMLLQKIQASVNN